MYETLDRVTAAAVDGGWRQDTWLLHSTVCGTAACFAGWTVMGAGYTEVVLDDTRQVEGLRNPHTGDMIGMAYISQAAQLRLGLTPAQAGELFCADNTLEEIKELVDEYCSTS